jgi:hypothetical protein
MPQFLLHPLDESPSRSNLLIDFVPFVFFVDDKEVLRINNPETMLKMRLADIVELS